MQNNESIIIIMSHCIWMFSIWIIYLLHDCKQFLVSSVILRKPGESVHFARYFVYKKTTSSSVLSDVAVNECWSIGDVRVVVEDDNTIATPPLKLNRSRTK
jgi:hypothetical protein